MHQGNSKLTFPGVISTLQLQSCNYKVVFFYSGGKIILQRCNYDDLYQICSMLVQIYILNDFVIFIVLLNNPTFPLFCILPKKGIPR